MLERACVPHARGSSILRQMGGMEQTKKMAPFWPMMDGRSLAASKSDEFGSPIFITPLTKESVIWKRGCDAAYLPALNVKTERNLLADLRPSILISSY